MSWFDILEYDLGTLKVPDALYKDLKQVFGAHVDPELLHPVVGEDVGFLMLKDEQAYLVRFDGNTTTTISFLGLLEGGRYDEVVEAADAGMPQVAGVFRHAERLGQDGELRVRFRLPGRGPGDEAAHQRSNAIRQQLRRWATGHELPPPR